MAFKRKTKAANRRSGGVAWDLAPLLLLAGAAVVLLQDPRRAKRSPFEPGRGRHARSPTEIPRRGWKDILIRAKNEFSEDQVPTVAAGVTFFILLSLFPGVATFVALYGLFYDVHDVRHQLAQLAYVLPPASLDFFGQQMVRMAEANKGGQTLTFIIGLVGSIWSANGAVKSLLTGLNIAYEEHETRGFVRRTAVSLAFTVGFLAFVIGGVALVATGTGLEAFVGHRAAMIFRLTTWPVLLLGMVGGLALLYRFGPSRDPVRWKWITWGSGGVIVFWMGASGLFSLYVGHFAHYDRTYGSLGAVVGFMLWIYLSTVVVLAGAEINAEIEHQTTVDTTTGAPVPMGLRNAAMADTVGAAQGR